jgi:outer membrane receptor for ferrienterochelin and colicin
MAIRLLRLLCVAIGVSILIAPIVAQTTSGLRGQVADESGAVIPGALVSLIDAHGKQRNAVASSSGEFVIPNVVPGTYTLRVSFKGFDTYLNNDVEVTASSSRPLKITLKVQTVSAETEITANGAGVSVEPDQNLNVTVLDEDFIQTLPDNEDDLRDFLQALAGPAAGGANGGQGGAQIYVDGFEGGRLPPRDAILQIRINQNPFSAEFAHPGVSRIEIITKPGSDQWHGSGTFSLRNSSLDARNAFAIEKPDLSQQRYTFLLSGPIVPKKASFFANFERRQLDGSGVVNAVTLDGPFVANVPAPTTTTFFGLRTDYFLNPKNTLNISYNYHTSESDNQEFAVRFGGNFGGASGSQFTLPERGSNATNTNHTFQLSETYLINANLIHESRLRYQHEVSTATADTQGLAINVLDSFYGGGSPCCPGRTRLDQLDWQDYLTWTHKKHTVKGGFQLEYDNDLNLAATNFNGTYTFSSLAQYSNVINGTLVPLDPTDPNSPLVAARPTQFTINRGDPLVRYNQYEAAWFVQDDFRLRPNLTLSVGLRHEFQSHLQDKINFAPRVGIAWSPFAVHKTTVRLGGGIFFARLTSSLYEDTLRYNGTTEQSIVIRNPLWPDPFAGSALVNSANTIIRTLDPNLEAPYVINFIGSVEHQLPRGFVVSASYIFTRGVHQLRSRNINAPLTDTLLRPDPSEGNIYQIESSASSLYEGLMFHLDRRFGRSFTLFSNYTLSHTMNDSDGPLSLPADNYNLRAEWGPASTERRNYLFVGGSVSLPHGFRLTPFVVASSGGPFNITTGFDENLDTVINDRPAGIDRNSGLPASLYPLLPDRLVLPPGSTTPVLLRDYLEANFPNGVSAIGPGLLTINLGLSKTFAFGHSDRASTPSASSGAGQSGRGMGGGRGGFGGGGRGGGGGGGRGDGGGIPEGARYSLTLSAQITNLLNHVNYGQFSGVLTSPFFDLPSSAAPARQFELGLKFNF